MVGSKTIAQKQVEPPAAVPEAKEKSDIDKRWPNPVLALVVSILIFVAGQVVGGIVLGILMSMTGEAHKEPPTLFGNEMWIQFVYALVAYGTMAVALVILVRDRGMNFRQIGLGKPAVKDIWKSIAWFGVYFTAYVVLSVIAKVLVPSLNVDQKQDIGFDGAGGLYLVPVFLALVVIAPVIEELLMRGFLFGALRQHLKFWLSALIVSVFFATLHLAGGEKGAGPLWIAGIDTFVLSWVLCHLREKTGHIWSGVGVHAIKNCLAFISLFIIHWG